jgi:hypothetical protein
VVLHELIAELWGLIKHRARIGDTSDRELFERVVKDNRATSGRSY